MNRAIVSALIPTPLVAVLGLLAIFLATGAWAVDSARIKGETPMRALPSVGAKVVQNLSDNTAVGVLKRTGLWFQVQTRDDSPAKGWVRFSSVQMTGTTTETVAAPAESSGVLSNLARSATGLFGYSSRQDTSQQSVSTIGIRGLSASDLKASSPDTVAQQRMETYRATPSAASTFARAGKLSSQDVAYLETRGKGFSWSLGGGSGDKQSDGERKKGGRGDDR